MMEFDDRRYYRTVRLAGKKTDGVEAEHSHLHLSNDLLSGRIRGFFRTLQALHVGTGEYVAPSLLSVDHEAPLVKAFHVVDGQPVIPGSSLKGPVRSLVEMITYSCVSKTRSRINRNLHGECRYNSRRNSGQICTACKLFGAMGYQGQISFADAPSLEAEMSVHYIPAQYQPTSNEERRYYPHDLQDERFPDWPLHIATPGSRFAFHVDYRNLEKGELGLLLLALGQGDPPLCLKIGAGKSTGMGAIRFEDVQAQCLDTKQLYLAYDSEEAWRDVDVKVCIEEAEEDHTLLRQDVLAGLEGDLSCRQLEED